jgi:hypothetical protein
VHQKKTIRFEREKFKVGQQQDQSKMTATSNQSNFFPVRLLSSVAVVGRDNEPIYLRGSLSEIAKSSAPSSPFSTSGPKKSFGHDTVAASSEAVDRADDWSGSDDNNDGCKINNEDGESSKEGNSSSKPGLLGRIKGAVSRRNDQGDELEHHDNLQDKRDGNSDNDDGDDDPFGFFGSLTPSLVDINKSTGGGRAGVPAHMMSLTQQLVLHASLDRFEEKMASRPRNGVPTRWRSPGSMGAHAMWMGKLCEVDERLSLYGYITNTGIKFILLLEISHINNDGTRCHDGFSHVSSYVSSVLSSLPSREADLKAIFARLHELYVCYTMNPFTKLRGPINSRAFDNGIDEIALSFNSSAIEQAMENGEESSDGLAWM